MSTYMMESTRSEVCDAASLIQYARDTFGVVITLAEKKRFFTFLKQFKTDNPHIHRAPKASELDQIIRSGQASSLSEAVDVFAGRPWQILAKGVEWGRLNGKNLRSLCGIFTLTDFAYQAGYIPELNPVNATKVSMEDAIQHALELEEDPEWRLMLTASSGQTRMQVLDRWQSVRAPVLEGVGSLV